jgi:hypothetical protein
MGLNFQKAKRKVGIRTAEEENFPHFIEIRYFLAYLGHLSFLRGFIFET